MSVTVVEQIAQVIESRLRNLLVDGENTVVTEVVRPSSIGQYTPQDMQIVMTQGETVINEELGCPGNPPATCFETTFNIRCHSVPDETLETAKDSYLNEFAADVRKVICSPQNSWHNFGSLAIDARFESTETITSEASPNGINIPLTVLYRTDENNPYNVRA